MALVIDFHTHIFPPGIRGSRERYLTDEPAFASLYRSPKARMAGAAELVAAMDVQAVDVSVVFGFPWRRADTFRRHNDYVLEAVARYPRRLVGFACMDPFSAEAESEAQRCLEAGAGGLGELAFYGEGILPAALERLAPLMALCRHFNLPVLIHTNEPVGHAYPGKTPNTLAQIYALVRRFSGNRIVLAHWGGGLFLYHLLLKEVAETLKNVYFDTAASPYLYSKKVYCLAAELAGAEKILFGSDFPLLKPSRYFAELAECGLPQQAVKNICGVNAAKLLGMNAEAERPLGA